MRRQVLAGVATLAVGLGITLTAYGALPKNGGVYRGTIKSTPFEMTVTLTVAPTGKKLNFTYLCGTGRPPTSVFGVPIDTTGHFKWAKILNNSVLVWKMAGRFTSATTAFISLNSVACGGSKGSATLALK